MNRLLSGLAMTGAALLFAGPAAGAEIEPKQERPSGKVIPICERENPPAKCGDTLLIGVPGSSSGRPSTSQPIASGPQAIITYVPTCEIGELGVADLGCVGAFGVCPELDQSRVWRYVAVPLPGGGYSAPVIDGAGPTCVGPGQAVDPLPAIIAEVATAWTGYDLPGWAFTTQPATGRVLINVPTRFNADVPGTIVLPGRTIYGRNVVVTLTVKNFLWSFGDGNSEIVSASDPYTEYAHREPGPFDVRLRTRYTATFTVAGSPATYVATGVANVDGPATELEVIEAHSELIAGDR